MPPSSRRYKDAIYTEIARMGKALASPRRLELLDLLAQSPRTVERLARETGQSIANTSQHLQILRAARLVAAEKRGLHVSYRLADAQAGEGFAALRRLAEGRLDDITRLTRDFLASRGLFQPVDREGLLQRVRRGGVTVIDVRPEEEYVAGHIPGARSVPLGELERRLAELPRHREVVAYCRGPYCVLAIEAVARLRARGYRASRLDAGVPEWRARAYPVESGVGPGARRSAR